MAKTNCLRTTADCRKLVGSTVRINSDGAGFTKGQQVKLVSYCHGTGPNAYYLTGTLSYYLYARQFDIAPITKEELNEERDDLMNQVSEINSKLSWMDEVGNKEYDEDEFRAWQALSIVDSATSKIEKARALAKLMKN